MLSINDFPSIIISLVIVTVLYFVGRFVIFWVIFGIAKIKHWDTIYKFKRQKFRQTSVDGETVALYSDPELCRIFSNNEATINAIDLKVRLPEKSDSRTLPYPAFRESKKVTRTDFSWHPDLVRQGLFGKVFVVEVYPIEDFGFGGTPEVRRMLKLFPQMETKALRDAIRKAEDSTYCK